MVKLKIATNYEIFYLDLNFLRKSTYWYTHPIKIIPIPAMVYFINDPDSQRSGRGMGGPTTSWKIGRLFTKYVPLPMHNFWKKSHLICPVECHKVYLIFLFNTFITQNKLGKVWDIPHQKNFWKKSHSNRHILVCKPEARELSSGKLEHF